MARTLATLPEGSRITDYVSLGVITKTFPLERVRSVLAATGKASERERDLPAHVVVYYAIALALYMQSSYREVLRCLLEGLQWLIDPASCSKWRATRVSHRRERAWAGSRCGNCTMKWSSLSRWWPRRVRGTAGGVW